MFNVEQKLAETKKEETNRLQELDHNNAEIERQEIKLDKLNKDIDQLQSEEKEIQVQLKNQSNDMDQIKGERSLVQEQIRQISNINTRL